MNTDEHMFVKEPPMAQARTPEELENSALTTSVQQCAGGSVGRKEGPPNYEERSKSVLIHRLHDNLWRKSNVIYKEAPRTYDWE